MIAELRIKSFSLLSPGEATKALITHHRGQELAFDSIGRHTVP